jgi:hypothetical protein
MELKYLCKHGTHILTQQKRGPLLPAADRIAFLKQATKTIKILPNINAKSSDLLPETCDDSLIHFKVQTGSGREKHIQNVVGE